MEARTTDLFKDLEGMEPQKHSLSPRLFQATGARVTPHAEWIEIQTKSVLNRVEGMPFKWSINPYRGCQHQCVFCIHPETRILMADGTHKPISEVRSGDGIYGTLRQGDYRHFVRTRVLAQWETRRPAYQITLEDGTRLITSGDHRFLTERGWKFVTGTGYGPNQRPFLTKNNKLMGVGAFSAPPQKNSDYQRGYLTGLIRGDGLLGVYRHNRLGRRHGTVYQFHLAMTDVEALQRADRYLRDFEVPTRAFVFAEGNVRHRTIHAIRTSSRELVAAVRYLIEWPLSPSADWCKGFLAGIFDAEGSHNDHTIRVANTDPAILDYVCRTMALFGFDHVREYRPKPSGKPITYVRLRGGLGERLRFFHTVHPAISRKCSVAGEALKSAAPLRVAAIESLGAELALVDITTGTGDFIADGVVSHNCYARRTHWFLDQDGVNNWGSRIFVKVNAPQVLRRELAQPSWTHEDVHLGTATDPYQPAEGSYKISRQILEVLLAAKTPVDIVTRSTMVVRDVDLLTCLTAGPGALVCFSIATMDAAVAREIEPDVPPPLRRLEALRVLAQAGVPVAVLLAPVIPGITDHAKQLAAVVRAAKDYGASSLWTNALHLGDVTRQAFFQYLERRRPELIPEYERMYRGKYAPSEYRRRIQEVVAALKSRSGFGARSGYTRKIPPKPRLLPEQLSLL
jgi:DNA repair photolyase